MSGSAPTVMVLTPLVSERVLVSNSFTTPGCVRSVVFSIAKAAMPLLIATLLIAP